MTPVMDKILDDEAKYLEKYSLVNSVPIIAQPADTPAVYSIRDKYHRNYIVFMSETCNTCKEVLNDLHHNYKWFWNYQHKNGIGGMVVNGQDPRFERLVNDTLAHKKVQLPYLAAFYDSEIVYEHSVFSLLDIVHSIKKAYPKKKNKLLQLLSNLPYPH